MRHKKSGPAVFKAEPIKGTFARVWNQFHRWTFGKRIKTVSKWKFLSLVVTFLDHFLLRICFKTLSFNKHDRNLKENFIFFFSFSQRYLWIILTTTTATTTTTMAEQKMTEAKLRHLQKEEERKQKREVGNQYLKPKVSLPQAFLTCVYCMRLRFLSNYVGLSQPK